MRSAKRGVLFYVLMCISCLLFVLCACLIATIVLLHEHLQKHEPNISTTTLPFFNREYELNSMTHDEELMLGDAANATNREWEKNFRLPADVVPMHYDLLLHPDLINGTFNGEVTITVKVAAPRKFLVLHSKLLDILETRLIAAGVDNEVPLQKVFEYKPNEFWVLLAYENSTIPPGDYQMYLKFQGSLTDKIIGFYRSVYTDPDTGDKRPIATSKFQPTYARQAFPCFDEPGFKSKFTIRVIRPSDGYSALSNMDTEGEIPNVPAPGLTTVKFNTSVPMVTYLACFIVSDFQSLPPVTVSQGFPVSVYSTPSQVSKTKFALEDAAKITEFYIKYFSIPYPLPKLDLVAIPDYVSGATEHWGIITFREANLLQDANISSTGNTQRVAMVVAHELAHMWFGNLMTLKWWNDLWLNEGFATYIEFKGVDHAHPEWNMMQQFVTDVLQPVMRLDGTLSSHPIVQEANHPDEINELFNTIAYNKGSSVLRMLEDFLGEENFRLGVSKFLNKYKFGNAVTQDLWDVLQEGAPDINVTHIMDSWTRQMGLPVVTVTRDKRGRITLSQKRFLADPDVTPTVPSYKWEIPITFITSASSEVSRAWLNSDMPQLVLDVPPNITWVKLNHHQVGYYRVNYDIRDWKMLTELLMKNRTALDVSDRVNILDDAFELAGAGLVDYQLALDITRYLERETDYVAWDAAAGKFGFLKKMLSSTTVYPKLRKYVRNLVRNIFNEIGWESSPSDSHLKKLLRSTIMSLGCEYGLPECMKEAERRFTSWITNAGNTERPPPDLRSIIYHFGMYATSSEVLWDKMWQIYLNETDAQEKVKLLYGLSSVSEPWLLQRFIEYAKDEANVRSQDFFTVLFYIAGNPVGSPIVWDFIRSEWQYLVDRFTLNDRYLGRLIHITNSFATEFKLQEIEEFFARYPEAGAGTVARKQAVEKVSNNIKWLKKHRDNVNQWLSIAVQDMV